MKRVLRKVLRIRNVQTCVISGTYPYFNYHVSMEDLKADLTVDFSFIYFIQSLPPQKRSAMNITNTDISYRRQYERNFGKNKPEGACR